MEERTPGGYRKACFSKLLQLQRLLEKFSCVLAEIGFHRELLDAAFDQAQRALSADTASRIQAITASLEVRPQSLLAQLSAAYRQKLRSVESDFLSLSQHHSESLAACETAAAGLLRDLALSIRQIGHNGVTAANAVDVQCKLTVKEIDRGCAAAREKFAAAMADCERSMAQKHELFEQEEQTRLNALLDEHTRIMRSKVKFPIRRYLTKDPFTQFSNELAEIRTNVTAIVAAAQSRLSECATRARAIVNEMKERSLQLSQRNGVFVGVLKLDEELREKIADFRRQNSELIVSKRREIEALQATLSKNRAIYKDALERRGSEVLESAQTENCALNELLKTKSDDLRCVRDLNREREDSVVRAWRELKRHKADLTERLEMQLEAVFEENRQIRKTFQTQIAQLRSKQQEQRKQLKQASADALEAHEKEVRPRVVQMRERQMEMSQLRSELAALKSVECASPIVSSSGSFDLSGLRDEFAAELEQRAAKGQSRMDALAKVHSRKEADLKRQLDAAYDAEMKKEADDCGIRSPGYLQLQQGFQAQEAEIEVELGKLKASSSDFSKSDRLIENLKHQQFQIRANIKFQRAALDSEWKVQIDAESARFEEVCMAFGEQFGQILQLFDCQTSLADFREKTDGESAKLEDELAALTHKNAEIQLSVATVKDQYGCVGHARVLLETAKEDADRRLSDASSCTEQERASLCALIVQVQSDIDREKCLIISQMEEIPDFDRVVRELAAQRDDRLRKLAEDTKAFLIELEKCKQMKRWEFERQQNALLATAKSQAEANKAEDFQRFTEFNTNLSKRNLDLEDLSRQNRAAVYELRHEQRGMLDFWNEKVSVAKAALDAQKVAFSEQGPRPIEQEKIDGLHTIAQMLFGQHHDLAVALVDVKKAIVKQENALNKRFGKRPKVGVVRSYPSAVV
jgi:hypothetical protein